MVRACPPPHAGTAKAPLGAAAPSTRTRGARGAHPPPPARGCGKGIAHLLQQFSSRADRRREKSCSHLRSACARKSARTRVNAVRSLEGVVFPSGRRRWGTPPGWSPGWSPGRAPTTRVAGEHRRGAPGGQPGWSPPALDAFYRSRATLEKMGVWDPWENGSVRGGRAEARLRRPVLKTSVVVCAHRCDARGAEGERGAAPDMGSGRTASGRRQIPIGGSSPPPLYRAHLTPPTHSGVFSGRLRWLLLWVWPHISGAREPQLLRDLHWSPRTVGTNLALSAVLKTPPSSVGAELWEAVVQPPTA